MNKENNANIQNITDNLSVSNFTLPNEPCMLELDQECNTNRLTNEVSMTNVSVCNLRILFQNQNTF